MQASTRAFFFVASLGALAIPTCTFSPKFQAGTVSCQTDRDCPAELGFCRNNLCESTGSPAGTGGRGGTGTGGARRPDGAAPSSGTGGATSSGGAGGADAAATKVTGDAMAAPDAPAAETSGPDSQPDVGPVVDAPVEMPVDLGPPPPPACAAAKTGEVDVWPRQEGNCSFTVPPETEAAASVDSALYASAATCGSCIEVTGSQGKVVARVYDQYPVSPDARGNKVSLSETAFNKVARPGSVLASMTWRWVPCQAMGHITAALKDYSNQYHWEIILENLTNRIVKLEYVTASNATWREVARESYNYFRRPNADGLPTGLRLTDVVGSVRTTGTLQWGNPITNRISLGVQFSPSCTP